MCIFYKHETNVWLKFEIFNIIRWIPNNYSMKLGWFVYDMDGQKTQKIGEFEHKRSVRMIEIWGFQYYSLNSE